MKYNVLHTNPKTKAVTLGGEPLTVSEIKKLAGEVGTLKTLRLWAIFQETIREHAVELGFNKSKNWDECVAGKMLAYGLDIMLDTVTKIELLAKQLK